MKKLSLKKIDMRGFLKHTVVVVIGTIILAFGMSVFMVPFNLVTGGVSGLSIALSYAIDVEFITVDLLVTVMTWLLFFVGWVFMGTDFMLKTLVSAIVYPI